MIAARCRFRIRKSHLQKPALERATGRIPEERNSFQGLMIVYCKEEAIRPIGLHLFQAAHALLILRLALFSLAPQVKHPRSSHTFVVFEQDIILFLCGFQ